MATAAGPATPGKHNFPGPVGTKRRRMRSGGNVSTLTNNTPKSSEAANVSEAKTSQTSKCKGTTTIPIFLKKTYKMIDTCDPGIATWTPDGEMFVVKDPDTFASQIIPQYFDHNKFSSFARQLNFYGFRKMQSKPIRNSDFDVGTAKHVTFYNENFKRGRCDLLKKIQRSTRGGNTGNGQDHQREVQNLKDQVAQLEKKIVDMGEQVEERMRRLELDMLSRMEQMMLAMQQQQQTQLQLQTAASIGTTGSSGTSTAAPSQQTWDTAAAFARGNSVNTNTKNSVTFQQPVEKACAAPPTLPPHPKQKQLPVGGVLPTNSVGGPGRINSLRDISTLSRGFSGLSRVASVESSASGVLMRNSWEDKLFSMLMLGDNDQNAVTAAGGNAFPASIAPQGVVQSNAVGPVTISENSTETAPGGAAAANGDDNLSDVSESEMHD